MSKKLQRTSAGSSIFNNTKFQTKTRSVRFKCLKNPQQTELHRVREGLNIYLNHDLRSLITLSVKLRGDQLDPVRVHSSAVCHRVR